MSDFCTFSLNFTTRKNKSASPLIAHWMSLISAAAQMLTTVRASRKQNDLSETFPLAPRQIECFVEHSTGHKWSILFDGASHINYIQQMNGKQRREIENVRTRECIESTFSK